MTGAVERKPNGYAGDANGQTERVSQTPPWLQAMAIGDGEWQQITKPQLRALADPKHRRKHPDYIRLWAAGMLASIGYKHECAVKQLPAKDVKPYMEVLRRFPKKEADGTVTEYALVPKPPIELCNEAGIDKSNFGRALRELQARGLAEQSGNIKNEVRVTFFARPHEPEAVRTNLVIGCDDQNLNPSNKITIAVAARWRKKFFPKLKTSSLPIRLDLVIDPEYQSAVEEGLENLYETVITPEVQKVIESVNQTFADASASDNQKVIGDTPVYKEERKLERKSTSAVSKGEQQQPAAAAAPPSKTTAPTKPNGGYRWPKTLNKAQAIFPKVSPVFIEKLALKAQAKRPGLTDDELAGCLVKKSGQNGEGLWLFTVPELVEALNEGRNPTPLTPREIIDNAKAAERAKKQEKAGTKWNQKTATP